MRRPLACLLVGLLGACSSPPPTQVLVWVDVASGSRFEADATELSVQVLDQDGTPVLDTGGSLVGEPRVELPASISLLPLEGDANRRFRVEARLRDSAGDELGLQVAEGGFVRDEVREVRLLFADDCRDISCSPARTCFQGACPRACFDARPLGDARPSEPSLCPDERCETDTCEGGVCLPRTGVLQLAVGDDHACAVAEGGRLFCWGSNRQGQLGLGEVASQPNPAEVALPAPVRFVAAGRAHTCAVLADASLHCWGANDHGELGFDGDDTLLPRAVVLPAGSEFDLVATGADHTCATLSDGTLYCWGDNEWAQIGDGTRGGTVGPTAVTRPPDSDGAIAEITAGQHHTCFRMSIGRVFCWGANSNGEIGQGDRVERLSPTRIVMGEGLSFEPTFTSLSSGAWHLCGLADEQQLFCWGDRSDGRVGLPEGMPGTKQTLPIQILQAEDWRGQVVAGGRRHSCAIRDDGSMTCFGTSMDGELGVGPTEVSEQGPVTLVDRGWRQVALGDSFGCATRGEDGAELVFCWGVNDAGQLGHGSREAANEPRRVCFP